MLAERIEAIARLLSSRSADAHDVLLEIAAEVRATIESYEESYRSMRERLAVLEAREQARLSTRAYSTSQSGYGDLATRAGYGDLMPGESRVIYESRPHSPTVSQPPHDGSYWHEPPSGHTQGRWIRPDEEIDHQSLRDGDPPYIAGPECEEPQ